MIFKPHNYQDHAIKVVLEKEACGLFLDLGLGKTAVTLTAIDLLMHDSFEIRKVLVIAPLKVAEDTWLREKDKWDHLKHLRISRVLGTAKERAAALAADADIYVTNRENVVSIIEYLGKSWDFDMLVIDELSSFKSPTAKRFRALRKVRPLIKRVVGLTGTPASNGYMDLWSEVYLLDRGERLGKTLTAYRDRFFTPGRRNGHIVFDWVLRAGSKAEIDRLLSDICVSMSAADWLEMPERIDNQVIVHMDEKTRAVYDQMLKDHIIPLTTGEDIVGLNAAAVMGKLLQLANGAVYDTERKVLAVHDLKLNALEELLEARCGEPTLIFYSYLHDLSRIQEKFPKARELKTAADIADWNAGKIEICICHPASAGHGLNLQDGGHVAIWFGLPWSLELYQQANARLHRQGQTKSVIIHHILTEGTVDSTVLAALSRKKLTQDSLLAAVKATLESIGGSQ